MISLAKLLLNKIKNINFFFLASLPNLRYLELDGCPVFAGGAARKAIFELLPNLAFLDGADKDGHAYQSEGGSEDEESGNFGYGAFAAAQAPYGDVNAGNDDDDDDEYDDDDEDDDDDEEGEEDGDDDEYDEEEYGYKGKGSKGKGKGSKYGAKYGQQEQWGEGQEDGDENQSGEEDEDDDGEEDGEEDGYAGQQQQQDAGFGQMPFSVGNGYDPDLFNASNEGPEVVNVGDDEYDQDDGTLALPHEIIEDDGPSPKRQATGSLPGAPPPKKR